MAHEKILIVDDEEDVLELVQYNLAKNSYSIETAATGEEALAKAKAQRPDLIILDLMLPGIDGLGVCKALKKDSKTECRQGCRTARRLYQESLRGHRAA